MTRKSLAGKNNVPITDPVASARSSGLRYYPDSKPGYSRRRSGKGFVYLDTNGEVIRDPDELFRIRSLVIPPAWNNVWICPVENGHLQATGRDAKGRKQPRYHTRWREVRDEAKYNRMVDFAYALPAIRRRVREDLKSPGLGFQKVMATVVRLLETTYMRVGNQEYARQNGSYGLTTLRNRHARVRGTRVQFQFRGKSGKAHNVEINDARLAKIVRRCLDIPGYELFQYLDENGESHSIDSADVNEYLRTITGKDFTAKDFRTWAGTVGAAIALQENQEFESMAEAKRNIVQAIVCVSEQLGNTPAVCRKCYIHPLIFESYLERLTQKPAVRKSSRGPKRVSGLRIAEARVLHLLEAKTEG